MSDRHWVEDLFPPRFGYTVPELLEGPCKDGAKKPLANVFHQVAQGRISPLDVSAIKNVYERVWLMTYLKSEGEKHDELGESWDTGQISPKTPRSPTKARRSQDKAVGTSARFSPDDKQTADVDDSCIWSSKEIDVLREVFKTAKYQNTKLQLKLSEVQEELQRLQTKYKKECKALEVSTRGLKEARKANERLKILCDNMKTQVDKSETTIDLLHDEIKDLRNNQLVLSKEIHNLKLALDKERIEHKYVELDLKKHHQEAQQDLEHREDQLKVLHEEDIEFLRRQLEEVKADLDKERLDHSRTKRGLDHLRTYFANVPLQGEAAVSRGVVNHSELSKWTY